MSEIVEIIDTLEFKIQKLFQKIDSLEEKNQLLQLELNKSIVSNQNQKAILDSLQTDFESLKMANSFTIDFNNFPFSGTNSVGTSTNPFSRSAPNF